MIRYRLSPQLLWALLVGQLVVLIPYFPILPFWVYVIFFIAAPWRLMVAYGYWSLPKNYMVYGVVILGALITFLNFGWSRDGAVTLLALAFSLKLLELKALRDSMIIIFLGLFLLAIYFLYSNSIGAAIYIFAAFVLLTIVLIGLNRIGDILPIRGVLQKALILLLPAIPLAGILFIFFPRMEMTLWPASDANRMGVSGFSNTVEPGDISRLAQSNRVVFRAKFKEREPLQKDLYWRGLVLSLFDGKRWVATDARSTRTQLKYEPDADRLSYEVFLEPTHQVWLFVIENLFRAKGEVVRTPDERLEAKAPVQKRFNYEAISILQEVPPFEKGVFEANERLPLNVNPKSRELAKKLFSKAKSNPTQYISLVLNHFRKNAYVYTLKPPGLSPKNAIDGFLFYSKKGFCEHYATAFTFLMRAEQIPARVVVGYQGGEFNPYAGYWTVREYHAHAWSEVWLPDMGWVRVDPTEVVSPHRIELGIDEDIKAEIARKTRSFLVAWLESSRIKPYFAHFLWGAEAVETFWQSLVVDYREEDQKLFLRWFSFSSFSWAPFMLVLLVLMGAVFIFFGFTFFSKRVFVPPQDPVLKAYHLFCRKLAKIGIIRKVGEGPQDFMDRVIHVRPDLRQIVGEINELYLDLRYRELDHDKQAEKDFYKRVKRLSV